MTGKARRRSPGSGSVSSTPRTDGRFAVKWRPPGAKRSQYRYAKTRPEAFALLARLQAGEEPAEAPAADPPLGDYLARWLAEIVAVTAGGVASENTRTHYRTAVDRISRALGHVPLSALTPQLVQATIAGWSAGYAPSTIRVTRGVLRQALGQAVDFGALARNPVDRTKAPPPPDGRDVQLAPEDIPVLLGAFQETRWFGVVLFAILYGMRRSEILGLRWMDVSSVNAGVDGEKVHVRGQLRQSRKGYVPRTKTGRGRELPLLLPAIAVLAVQRQQQDADRSSYGGRWQDTGFVFTAPDGRPASQNTLAKVYRRQLAGTAFEALRFHDLRHGQTSLLRALGVDERTRMDILGHRRPETTLLYTHSNPAAVRTALEQLAALLPVAGEGVNEGVEISEPSNGE